MSVLHHLSQMIKTVFNPTPTLVMYNTIWHMN